MTPRKNPVSRQIAFYGKGGIGKSMVAANLSAVLAGRGRSVLQVGCDPKADSCKALLGGRKVANVLELLKTRSADSLAAKDFLHEGFAGVHCIEAGGPEPGIGCAGRGIILAIDVMTKTGVYARGYDYVIYDVLGDVVCGGFAVPIREGYADRVYLVVSGEFLSLYAANNIMKAIHRHAQRSATRLAGIVANLTGAPRERPIVTAFAAAYGLEVLEFLPRDPAVQDSENHGMSVIERHPDSPIGKRLAALARKIETRTTAIVPKPLDDSSLNALVLRAARS
ncbi:MAG: hypothetical protein HY924_03195 [Elusimicrobia bacterium]|nr:hypothetical protein [Elusimicrobiota bacterium]